MAMTPEKKVKNKVVQILKDFSNTYYFYPFSGGFGKSGVPDIIVCCNGKFLGIECKAGKNQPTALQYRELRAIEAAGGVALVVRDEASDQGESFARLDSALFNMGAKK